MIHNAFWALGPNVTGYPGGFPNGLLQRLEREGYLQPPVLHVCSGSVKAGITVDIKRENGPTVCADGEYLPFRSPPPFVRTAMIDPPYSEGKAADLYALPLINVVTAVSEMARIVQPGGRLIIFDLRVWHDSLGKVLRANGLEYEALIACHMANRGPKPLRAIAIYRKTGGAQIPAPTTLEAFS